MDPQLSPSSFRSHFKIQETWKHTMLFSFQSLGVVYGRLSTVPLYVFGTMRPEDFKSAEGVYELLSFVFWTITIFPLFKYAFVVLRADDNGEGGTFALYSLLCRHAKVGLLPNDKKADEIMYHDHGETLSKVKAESKARKAIEKHKTSHYLMLFSALFGACMIIADGVLTPAISVLSASSGLRRSLSDLAENFSSSNSRKESLTRDFKRYVPVPSACAILICLFTLQHYGTHKIGFIFAPIIIVWLLFITILGIYNVLHWDIQIIYAISPIYMYKYIRHIGIGSWRLLGSILLCVAGSESMFADLGHFSKKSVKITFVCLIYPALILCYAGQAAFISKNIGVSDDFNHLSESVPGSLLRHVFIVWSLFASVVGSQATITASFSIINQCLALGCFPRVKVVHTSDKMHGQIYIPDVNWLLMVLSLAVTIGFHDIARIGNAIGLAIICGMLVTTCLMSLVIALYWEWKVFLAACFLIFFGFVEAMYLSVCILNVHKGAWFLLVLVVCTMTIMLAWHYGTMKKYEFDQENKVSMEWLTDLSPGLGVSRVPGIGFIHSDIVTGIPAFFSHFITNIPAFHKVLIFVSFRHLPVPYVLPSRRYLIGRVGPKEYKIYRCIVGYGYCDRISDMDNFEDQIIQSIGEFISMEENDSEAMLSPEGKMIIVGNPTVGGGNALIPLNEESSYSTVAHTTVVNCEIQSIPAAVGLLENGCAPVRRKKRVRFMLPLQSPKMQVSVREELQELVDARESGTAYFMGQSHLSVRNSSNYLKQFLVLAYVFLDKNCREPHVALNIPHAALVEVGMVYTI